MTHDQTRDRDAICEAAWQGKLDGFALRDADIASIEHKFCDCPAAVRAYQRAFKTWRTRGEKRREALLAERSVQMPYPVREEER